MFLDSIPEVAAWLAARAELDPTPGQGGGNGGGSGAGSGAGSGTGSAGGNGGVNGFGGLSNSQTRNTTGFGGTQGMNFMAFNALRFAGAKSIRTSTIILAIFNVIAAFGVVLGIVYVNYKSYRRSHPKFRFRRHGFAFVHPSEVYPLVLCAGITVQGTVFAVAQSRGLSDINTLGCTLISQFMLPALFIVPYIQLVFGVEMTIRALRKNAFHPRGRWDVTLCLSIVGMLLLINFLVADFVRTGDFCFASLFWFVVKYSVGIFFVLLVIAVVLIVCVTIIFVKLSKTARIDRGERLSASRMVYYLALAIISTSFMLPFYFFISFNEREDFRNFQEFQNQALTLSMVGTVVANVSGLMTGGLHLFLRSNTISTIKPKHPSKSDDDKERDRLKHKIRLWGPNQMDYGTHVMRDLRARSRSRSRTRSLRRMDSSASLIDKAEEVALSSNMPRADPNALRSNTIATPSATTPRVPSRAKSPFSIHSRKRSFNFFQGGANKSLTMLPATTYNPNSTNSSRVDVAGSFVDDDASTLKPPPSVRANGTGRHRRDSSMASSATVLFGLRLSHVEDMPPLQPKAFQSEGESKDAATLSKKSSPLSQAVTAVGDDSGSEYADGESKLRSRDPVKDARMKTLPPVPRRGEPQESYLRDPDDDDDDNAAVPAAQQQAQQELVEEPAPVLLSPTVYKPPSPKTRPRANTATEVTAASIVRTGSSQRGIAINGGINVVNIPQRSNTTAGTMRSPKQQTSPPPRPSGSLSPKAKQCDEAVKRAKSEWI